MTNELKSSNISVSWIDEWSELKEIFNTRTSYKYKLQVFQRGSVFSNKSQYIHFVFQNFLKRLFKLRGPKWLDIVEVKFVFFLRQPLQISERFN